MATVYDVLDTRDKQELTEKIDADKNELSKTIQNTKIELQSNIDALESQHDEDKTNLQTQIDSLESTKADKTEITAHNTSNTAHNDIRLLIQNLTTKLNTIADSDDSTLDQMSEIVEYIKNNKELIDSITTTKVSVSDIINNLVTNVANKPLSAAMGVELKALIDAIPDTTLATVNEKILEHNVSADAHEDIRNDIASVQSDATAAQTTADAAQALANNAQDDADEALQRLNSLEVGSGKIDRIVDGGGVLTCEDPLIGVPLIKTGVRGRTVNNLWMNPATNTKNGVTLTNNGDGSITVRGTATAATEFAVEQPLIKAGSEYTISASRLFTGVNILLASEKQDGTWLSNDIVLMGYSSVNHLTGTANTDGKAFNLKVGVADGTTVDASFRVMLVKGTGVPDCFTPTGTHGVEPEKLVVAGRNLSKVTEATVASESGVSAYVDISDELPPGTYTVKGVDATGEVNVCARSVDGSAATIRYNSVNQGQTANIPSGYKLQIYHNPNDGVPYSVEVSSIQLELGSTATAYEPPAITEVALPDTDPLMYIYDRGDEMAVAQDGTVSVERQTFHELYDGGTGIAINVYVPVEADGYQYVALNSTKDKPTGVNISMDAVISDRFATGKRAPGNVVVTTGSVSGDGRNYIAFLFCFESGTFADSDEARQWFVDNPTNVWFAGMPEIEYLGTIEPPTLPAQTSHVWFSSNIPVNDFSVRYWLPNGELVEELYRTGATEEISDNEIISIWNGVTGDIIEATNADIEAIFE